MEKNTLELKFTKDKPIMILAVTSSVISVLTFLSVIIRLRSNDFKVPVQYVVHDGAVLQTSNWFSLYSLALFSVLTCGAIIFLAHRLYKGNRVFAVGVLAVYTVISVITLFVTNALLGLVGRV